MSVSLTPAVPLSSSIVVPPLGTEGMQRVRQLGLAIPTSAKTTNEHQYVLPHLIKSRQTTHRGRIYRKYYGALFHTQLQEKKF